MHDRFSTEASNVVLDYRGKLAPVSTHLPLDQLQSFCQRIVTPSVEELVLFVDKEDRPSEKGYSDIEE